MTKKHLAFALSLMATVLLAQNVFAATACSTGATIQFMGAGSSAQFNTLAYAAEDIIGSANFNLMSFKGNGSIVDSRPNYEATPQPSVSDSATIWIAWDNGANCNVYTYFSVDSGIGVKDFMAAIALKVGTKTYQVAGAYPTLTAALTSSPACAGTLTNCNQVGGLLDIVSSVGGNTLDVLPTTIYNAMTVIPASYVAQVPTPSPQPYCGQLNGTAGFYCSFNVAGTDIRPEDALYAVTRALSAYNTTNGISGLGYGQTGCGANATYPTEIGCPIYDAFGQKKEFNVINFALSGADPIAKGTVQKYTTLSVGASPVVVFVNNGDTANFGSTSGGNYVYTDITRGALSQVFNGTLSCTADILASGAPGAGAPIQVVQREPLSGTYNTFEFTGVRTLGGSAATAVPINKVTSLTWITNDDSGQELGINPTEGIASSCQNLNGSTVGVPAIGCGDPVFVYSGPSTTSVPTTGCSSGSTTLTGGAPLRLRAIGTGEEVPAALAAYNPCTSGSNTAKCASGVNGPTSGNAFNVVNGIGYSFWSYGNLAPMATGQSCTTSNPVTCTAYNGHYLTVNGVDPLFATAGGALDTNANPAGAFNVPQCNLNGTLPCWSHNIPFTNIYNGSYPLWSLLRLVTFENVSGKSATPAAVLNMTAYDQEEVANASRNTADFVPFLTNLTNSGSLTAPAWTGNLNLWVFREHFVQSKINGYNGHSACSPALTSTTTVSLQGGTSGQATCLVDLGGDVGGEVMTVQADFDFNSDFGNVVIGTSKDPEFYGRHQ